jgi:hypothetical protein
MNVDKPEGHKSFAPVVSVTCDMPRREKNQEENLSSHAKRSSDLFELRSLLIFVAGGKLRSHRATLPASNTTFAQLIHSA